ncbi:MAG: TadE/TadG family type IV pilus assembly protein [Anaerolineae bacterium]
MNIQGKAISKRAAQTGPSVDERNRGQSLVEVALALPFLLILFLGMVEVGWYMYAANIVHNTAREGARVAAKENVLDPKTIQDWASLVLTDVIKSTSNDYISPNSTNDTVIVTRATSNSQGSLTYCESMSAVWPDTGSPGPDTSRVSCADLQAKIIQMGVDLGGSFGTDDFIVVEYFHHHDPLFGLTVVAPQGLTLYSYSIMRIIGQ